MDEPPIKQKLESQELTGHPADVQHWLNACLNSDPAHNTPRAKGDHVKVIQKALMLIRSLNPSLGLAEITDNSGEYGVSTANVVLAYKKSHKIIRRYQRVDNIVGRMTITQIDNDLLRRVRPEPRPAIPTIVRPIILPPNHTAACHSKPLRYR